MSTVFLLWHIKISSVKAWSWSQGQYYDSRWFKVSPRSTGLSKKKSVEFWSTMREKGRWAIRDFRRCFPALSTIHGIPIKSKASDWWSIWKPRLQSTCLPATTGRPENRYFEFSSISIMLQTEAPPGGGRWSQHHALRLSCTDEEICGNGFFLEVLPTKFHPP